MMAKIKKIPNEMIWMRNPAMRTALAVAYNAGLLAENSCNYRVNMHRSGERIQTYTSSSSLDYERDDIEYDEYQGHPLGAYGRVLLSNVGDESSKDH